MVITEYELMLIVVCYSLGIEYVKCSKENEHRKAVVSEFEALKPL